MRKIRKTFFEDSTINVAKKLLGSYLVHESPDGRTVGKIVETEAYLWDDPASHSFVGATKRNAAMFGPAGTAYVYFTYGMYYCFNVVTNKEGIGEAVLIRALEPISGVELMKKRRGVEDVRKLCAGPGRLVIAMGIGKEKNGLSLFDGELRIELPEKLSHIEVIEGERIGISKGVEMPHRFYLKGSMFVSR